ncbi:hypothetical protein [Microbacterium testaceum]|uniref:hypothetical protein n=1 Tax=Microbacterium testaceum TaxID=2033 RepID=UPI001D17CB4A|nr:hypothetical protein [Microbacterium testaceum]MCC4248742.1 hypothetical protein [Microbacterium testaceum]
MSTSTSSSSPAVRAVRTALAVSGAISLIVGLLILLWPGRTAEVAVGITESVKAGETDSVRRSV